MYMYDIVYSDVHAVECSISKISYRTKHSLRNAGHQYYRSIISLAILDSLDQLPNFFPRLISASLAPLQATVTP